MRSASRWAAAGTVMVLALTANIVARVGPASGQTSTFSAPVYAGDFPDPAVMAVNGTYWAWSTGSGGRNLQAMSSPDLRTWSAPVDPLPILPSWASSGRTWAPGVMRIANQYVMYYTVHDTALNRQCISVATSATPQGPYTDSRSGPLVCQTANGGSIDPNPYLDPVSGGLYLLWKSDDNALGQRTHIWGQRLTANGLEFYPGTAPSLLLTQSSAWQSPAIEGPTIVRRGTAYYLFYGANSYNTASSGIGYATSRSLLGAYTNQSVFRAWVGTTGNAKGPQGPMVFTDLSGATRMAFAAWYGPVGYQNGGVRSLWIGSLGFTPNGQPRLG